VDLVFEDNGIRKTERRPFSFTLSPQDAEDIRWYLEDYLVYPLDPAPKIASRIERRMAEIGRELFRLVLAGSDVWETVRGRIGNTRIEVETGPAGALVPWELIRDPVDDLRLALETPSFVRCHPKAAKSANSAALAPGKIRILLAICRLEDDKIPFRSVARYLIRGLSDAARKPFYLEVLRPPTFEQLAKRLRAAKARGEPFHLVHFDGHGRSGEIFFENPELQGNAQSIRADELGKLLHETCVPLLILNACRSAASEPATEPVHAGDIHQQTRQFGSFAHGVMAHGASGVVAWRYSVFVKTAAQYMADLYASLASGAPLGEAASLARKQLSRSGQPIEDWTVPVVFEADSIHLFGQTLAALEIKLETRIDSDSAVPQQPDIGFIGNDHAILRLDRMFNEQRIVLLHDYAGSGKTSAASEFASWYCLTGGVSGPVLYTSFEQHRSMASVLEEIRHVFETFLAKNRIQWLTLSDPKRREITLEYLRQAPVFWIWDNVESIAGFPSGTPSHWSANEQGQLVDFLRAAGHTKAKVLLISRRDERAWLHDLPARIELPAMPFHDCVQMTEEMAKKFGVRLEDVEDWRSLIRFTLGNPLALTVWVGQALRDELKTAKQIENFVLQLQNGESVFTDEASAGRAKSLGASLAYGSNQGFTETERKQLAVLYLFQAVVDVEALRLMGDVQADWCLPELKQLTREAGVILLDRAAEVGLLTVLGRGYYRIHPALPWFFRPLFEQHYSEMRNAATRAYVEAIGQIGNYCWGQYQAGDHDFIAALEAQEANLLHARRIARSNRWWNPMVGSMQGLRSLYEHTGRTAEWGRIVDEIVPNFVDPTTDGPLPDTEVWWSVVTGYRVWIARGARRWEDAERLQDLRVASHRVRTASVLKKPIAEWSAEEKNAIRSLGVSLHDLSEIQRERGLRICVDGYQEALTLAESIQDFQGEATAAFNLGKAYDELPEIRDFAMAERWYVRSFGRRAANDRIGRCGCLNQLGNVALKRFLQAQANGPANESLQWISQAAVYYEQALNITPENAPRERALLHNQLGIVFAETEQLDTALRHFTESVHYYEAIHDPFEAGRTRSNAARALGLRNHFVDAREWARSALQDLQSCQNADQDVADTVKRLEWIDSSLEVMAAVEEYHSYLDASSPPPQPSGRKPEWKIDFHTLTRQGASPAEVVTCGESEYPNIAHLDLLDTPVNIRSNGPSFFVVRNCGGLFLDQMRIKRVLFINCHIVYKGNKTILQDLRFHNCTFELPDSRNGGRLATALKSPTVVDLEITDPEGRVSDTPF
jgi:tetratricopeptide (TPR) repeat protein